jgi:hypothetical protein
VFTTSVSVIGINSISLTFKDEAYLFHIRIQSVPRSKHSPARLQKPFN